MTFDDWWAAYDPADVNMAADKNMARQAWDAASEVLPARVRELEAERDALLNKVNFLERFMRGAEK